MILIFRPLTTNVKKCFFQHNNTYKLLMIEFQAVYLCHVIAQTVSAFHIHQATSNKIGTVTSFIHVVGGSELYFWLGFIRLLLTVNISTFKIEISFKLCSSCDIFKLSTNYRRTKFILPIFLQFSPSIIFL